MTKWAAYRFDEAQFVIREEGERGALIATCTGPGRFEHAAAIAALPELRATLEDIAERCTKALRDGANASTLCIIRGEAQRALLMMKGDSRETED
jgi:hypothetical protein